MFILLLTIREARQTKKHIFCKPEGMKTCMFNPTISSNLTTLPADPVSLNSGTTTAANTSQLRLGLLFCDPSVKDCTGTSNTNAY